MTTSSPIAATAPAPADAGATGSLVVTDLHKEYPTPTEPLSVLRGVTFALSAGQSLAIVGPSGSGKSTLLNILGTLDRPSGGSVRIDGVDPFALAPNPLARFRSAHVGFIFQDHHLLPQLSAAENVLVPKLATGGVGKADSERALDLLRRVGLAERSTHLPSELSGGERQRVAIARALMNGPSLLLCDEPTGNLDQRTSQTIADLLFGLAAELKAILVAVTHSRDLAGRFGRRMRMGEGELVED